jgi:hypothetical protein
MVNVLESTLEWTKGEVMVNSGIGSHTPCFFWIRPQMIYGWERQGKLLKLPKGTNHLTNLEAF